MSLEAMKQALEALEGFIPYLPLKDKEQCDRYDIAITSLRQAIAEAENIEKEKKKTDLFVNQMDDAIADAEKQEPVAWLFQNEETGLTECVDTQQVEWGFEKNNPRWQKIAPLYTHPPKREWVGLTDQELKVIHNKNYNYEELACAIEAKLKEKNA